MVGLISHLLGGSHDQSGSDRALEAVRTRGRSEVERVLTSPVPPRRIEVHAMLAPILTERHGN
ncbi:MAG TPA: hypothetical protein VGM91_22180 [Conexibacter sp.]|jgi:hypothetical protein